MSINHISFFSTADFCGLKIPGMEPGPSPSSSVV
jgi:hypothetical protein